MDLVLRSAAVNAIAQKDGNSINQFTLLITIPPKCHFWGSITPLIAGSVINRWYLLMLKQIAAIVIMIFISQLWVPIVPGAIPRSHGW
jgi:hypothetical protein